MDEAHYRTARAGNGDDVTTAPPTPPVTVPGYLLLMEMSHLMLVGAWTKRTTGQRALGMAMMLPQPPHLPPPSDCSCLPVVDGDVTLDAGRRVDEAHYRTARAGNGDDVTTAPPTPPVTVPGYLLLMEMSHLMLVGAWTKRTTGQRALGMAMMLPQPLPSPSDCPSSSHPPVTVPGYLLLMEMSHLMLVGAWTKRTTGQRALGMAMMLPQPLPPPQ